MTNMLRSQIEYWFNSKTLLTIKILNAKGKEESLHGRIISYEPESNNILFYEDDFKRVDNILLSEILNVETS
ncbi:hypothetical protein [Paenibacillus polymyxa]|uniref:YolD-like family protein n=1 Tax=Paenibacillus polymyxa (strain SC2) TaxID=886882 RepID=E3EJW4_PAEPS|nr:hypothetical protein [Paenibacillus polymyxa]ADO59983.1 hypothetical protein PPSC2_28265 [Paenibacillus polymyxa SC2]WPQ59799.1 hypothetical protein SKN87_26280 [Paenibacillus polymyxa]